MENDCKIFPILASISSSLVGERFRSLIINAKNAIGGLKGSIEKESIEIWLLNSNLVIANNASLAINSSEKVAKELLRWKASSSYRSMIYDSRFCQNNISDPAEKDYFHTKRLFVRIVEHIFRLWVTDFSEAKTNQ